MGHAGKTLIAIGALASILVVGGAGRGLAQPSHYVVFDSRDIDGRSTYEVEFTGTAEKVSGRIAGIRVSANDSDSIRADQIEGEVGGGADGYRISGGIEEIEIANPDNVQVYVGRLGGESSGGCRVGILAESVESLKGQGTGEGPLELSILHEVGGSSVRSPPLRVPEGERRALGTEILSQRVPHGKGRRVDIAVQVTEIEAQTDFRTGKNDRGTATLHDVKLACGKTRRVSKNVKISGDRDRSGRVRITYTLRDTGN